MCHINCDTQLQFRYTQFIYTAIQHLLPYPDISYVNFEKGIKVETIIIITSLIVLTGFIKVFSNQKNDLSYNDFEEAIKPFIVPSVLNNIKPGNLWQQFEPVQKEESDSAYEFENKENELYSEIETNNDFDEHTIEEHHPLNKKVIVYKAVTKRMTLVKVF